jgi:hypothetical protein
MMLGRPTEPFDAKKHLLISRDLTRFRQSVSPLAALAHSFFSILAAENDQGQRARNCFKCCLTSGTVDDKELRRVIIIQQFFSCSFVAVER